VHQGEAKIVSPWEVRVNGKILTTRSIVIAAGACPSCRPISESKRSATSRRIRLEPAKLPERLVVLGGGRSGASWAQCFARLGSKVTRSKCCADHDPRRPEISEMVLAASATKRRCAARAQGQTVPGRERREALICEHNGRDVRIPFDEVLLAVGRIANTAGYGLESWAYP